MESSCTALCVIFLISGAFINGENWTCPPISTSVFVREIQEAELRFDVDLSSLTFVTYRIWSPTSVALLTAVCSNNKVNAYTVNTTYCISSGRKDDGQLYINLTDENTAGVYRLEKSPGIHTEKCIIVYILGKPTLPMISEFKDPLVGESVTVTCNSTSTTTPSNHNLSIAYDWMINRVKNPGDSRYKYSLLNQAVAITNITKQDVGKQMTCTATEQISNGYTSDNSRTVNISVIYGPDPCENLLLLYVYTEGEIVSDINCSSDCYPSCMYKWTSQNGVVSNSGILSLRNISRDQAGNYSFTTHNTAPSYNISFQKSVQIVVKYAPVVNILFSTMNRTEGSRLKLYCAGEGVPTTYVYTGLIQKVGEIEIPNSNTAVEGSVNYSSIHFPSLRLEDTGNYTCTINNGIKDLKGGLDQLNTTEILVQIKPKVLQTNLLFAGATGGSVLVQVPFYCYPAVMSVKFSWTNGTEIQNSTKYNTSLAACIVNDTFYGRRVMLPGFQAQMTIAALEEEDFMNFTLTLTNKEGKANFTVNVIAESIPNPPKRFEYLLVYGRAKFFWEKGFNGGLPQTFVIQISVSGREEWTTWTTVFENDEQYKLNDTFYSADINGLQHGIYTARLLSENSVGSTKPVNLNASFTIAKEEDISGKKRQTVTAAAGGAISTLVVIIAVAFVVFVWKRRTENKASQLHLKKHGKIVQKDNSDEDVEVENPMYASAELKAQGEEKVNAKQKKKQEPIPRGADVYAVVDKSKAANKKKKGKLTATKLSTEGDIYDNSPTKIEDCHTYGNAAFGDTALETSDDSTSQTNKGSGSKDGLVYADLVFAERSNRKKPVTERTPYAQVDFQKRADPLPDSYSEEPEKTSKH